MKCCINGCDLQYESVLFESENVFFHGLLRKNEFNEDWLEAIRCLNGQYIDTASAKNRRICSKHFEADCYIKVGILMRLLPGSVPTIFPKLTEEEMENVEFLSSTLNNNADEVCDLFEFSSALDVLFLKTISIF